MDFLPCKRHKIPFILVTWDPKSKDLGHLKTRTADNLNELKEQIQEILGVRL